MHAVDLVPGLSRKSRDPGKQICESKTQDYGYQDKDEFKLRHRRSLIAKFLSRLERLLQIECRLDPWCCPNELPNFTGGRIGSLPDNLAQTARVATTAERQPFRNRTALRPVSWKSTSSYQMGR